MDYLPYSQEYMLAVSVMAGVLLGFLWDIYRLIRHYGRFKTRGTLIGDIIYWIISIKFGTQLILDISYGNVRFFILMGFCAGALLYFWGISEYVLKVFVFIVDYIIRVITKIIHSLTVPAKFIMGKIKVLLYPLKLKYLVFRDKLKKRHKFMKFKLKKVFKNKKMIYNRKKRRKRKKSTKTRLKHLRKE
ncbi:MAG: spore cortex biosynthesis protein YabQ [Bacillota bacterium]|jgi:spore cortex biosynthesis protein YabQ|nr:spore cortex biosynthesis protein YabQ [Bacillota bacterium]NLL59927.1 hypothetical protein [Tissierellia bacterium]